MVGPNSHDARPAALLLTGGASRRMGRDKATLVVAGETLAARTAALLLEIADPVFEIGPGFTGLPSIQEHPPGAGPLAALAAGTAVLAARRAALAAGAAAATAGTAVLADGATTPALVVATDLPRLTAAFLRRLAEHPVPTPDHSVVPRDRNGNAQPLCARYSPAALACSQDLVAVGYRSMRDLLQRVPVIFLDADADTNDALRDVDTPADLADLNEASRRP